MSYRDDRDADRARITALEAELAAERQKVAELEGRRSQALVLASQGALAVDGRSKSASKFWLGTPLELSLSKELAGSFPVDKFEDIIETIRLHTREAGRSELLKTSLTWSASAGPKSTGPFTVITVSVRDGVTRILATDKLGQLAGALYGGLGGGVGGGAIFGPIMASVAVPVLAPLFFAGWFGGVYWGTRAIYTRVARRRAEQLQQLFDVVCTEVARTIKGTRSTE
jgi:hypothetical protein